MRLTYFLVLKNWASSPLRILLTLVGIALGVAVVTSIHVLDHNTILSQLERKRGDFGRVDMELRPLTAGADLAALRKSLLNRADVAKVGLIVQASVEIEGLGGASLYGLTPPGAGFFHHYRVDKGEDLSDLDPEGSVLIARPLAERLGVKPGDTIEIKALPWFTRARCVKGVFQPSKAKDEESGPPEAKLTIKGILDDFRIARRDRGLVIVGSFSLARKFARPFMPLFQVDRAKGVDPDRLYQTLRKDFHVDESRTALIGEAADERAFRNGVKVLGCLALVLGMFVIFHTLSHSLAEKIRSVGILRALGATQKQVSRVFMADAFLLSLAGTALGLVLGLFLAKGLGSMNITTLGLGKQVTTFEIPWTPLMAVGGMGIFFTLLGAFFPLMKVRRLAPSRILYVRDLAPPADLMRGVNFFLFIILVLALPLAYLAMTPLLAGEGKGAGLILFQAIGIVGLFFAMILLSPGLVRLIGGLILIPLASLKPLAVFLVKKNLLRSPGRLATAVCGLTLVALAMVGLKSLTSALKEEIRVFAKEGMRGCLFLRSDNVGRGLWERMRKVDGVASLHALSARVPLPFRTIGIDSEELAKPGEPLAGRPKLMKKMKEARGLMVSRRLANLRNLRVGMKLPVPTEEGTVYYEVVAVSDRAGFFPDERAYALADKHWIHWDFCTPVDQAGHFQVRLDPEADMDAVMNALRKIVEPYAKIHRFVTGEEVEGEHVADVDRDFLFFDILLFLLLLLAGTGQVNLITLTALARSREIGVLRALGMTRGDFLYVLLVEAAVIGFIASAITLLAGIPLSFILVQGLKEVSGLTVPYVFPWQAAFFAMSMSFFVSLASALPPAFHATGRPPARAVRSTE